MRNTYLKFILFLFLITYHAQSQELKIEYDRTFTDTADFIYQTIVLRVRDFPENTNTCELINAVAIDESNQKIKPEYFLTQANREFWITFKKKKNSKKIKAINGKAKFFNTSEDEDSKIIVDDILSKINTTIYSQNETKIVVLDIEALNSKKEKSTLAYKTEVESIAKANQLNKKWLEATLKKSLEMYFDPFNLMIYCEDPKNSIDDVDELFKTFNKNPVGVKNNLVKTFLFAKTDSNNKARITINDSKTFNEADFKVEIVDEE